MKELLSEAAEWRLLGLLFEYPTDAWRAQVTALLPDLREEEMRRMGEEALEVAKPGLHIALFGPAGTVPVREVTYQGGVQFGYLMAELAAYYSAFGYAPAGGETDDHLSVELGFMAYLKMKQAFALAAGAAKDAEVTEAAAAEFVKEHLATMGEPVANRLENFAPDYLIAAGRRVAARVGPPRRSGYPLAPLGDDDGETMTCGAGDPLVQLEG